MKLENLKSDIRKNTKSDDFIDNLTLVRNEFRKETDILSSIRFGYLEDLTPDRVTVDIIDSALKYTEALRKHYVKKYTDANNIKDQYITRLESEDKDAFVKLRNEYFNSSLEELVTFKDETQKIIDYKGEIVQKLDPVYMDPGGKCIKAHFYAPFKMFCGFRVETYIVNVIVIWLMTFVLYLVLYFRVLKHILNSGEKLFRRKLKMPDFQA